MRHRELVDIGAKWLKNTAPNCYLKCQFVVTDFMSHCSERPDIYGLRGYKNIMIEVKISKADFKADFKKKKSNGGVGYGRYYLCPTGLIEENELPKGYGLLYCNDKKEIEIIRLSKGFEDRNHNGENLIYYSIIRRLAKPQIFDFN